MQMSTFPRDLLQKFISTGSNFPRKYSEMKPTEETEEEEEEEEEIELSLGLSLNGRFGVDPIRSNNKFSRSSSIPDFLNLPAAADEAATFCLVPMNTNMNMDMTCGVGALTRTCSLPVETEQQWRKRKELQSQRRMAAKRKRTEKQRNINIRAAREREGERCKLDEDYEEDNNNKGVIFPIPIKGNEQFRGFNAHGIELKGEKGNGLLGGCGLEGVAPPLPLLLPPPLPHSSQGSIGSQGSGSSGISEFESQPVQGRMTKCIEVKSPASMQSLPNQTDWSEQKPAVITAPATAIENHGNFSTVMMEKPSQKLSVGDKGAKEMMRNMMADMPCVSTKGYGPNGKRIEGFLYRYGKGEEVRIVCVCHGSFLSPAEFVKHAGGSDVEHPLKHIVVNPHPFL